MLNQENYLPGKLSLATPTLLLLIYTKKWDKYFVPIIINKHNVHACRDQIPKLQEQEHRDVVLMVMPIIWVCQYAR